jgi:hypothetical protein
MWDFGFWILDCRLQIADCRLQIADCRLQIADLYICIQSQIGNPKSAIAYAARRGAKKNLSILRKNRKTGCVLLVQGLSGHAFVLEM